MLLVTNPAPVVALISSLRKKCQFKLNILVHDVFPENTIPAGLKLPKIAYILLKNIFDKAYGRADQLIALGRDMKQVLEQKVAGLENHPKVTIIENWADLDIVSPMESAMHPDKFVLEYALKVLADYDGEPSISVQHYRLQIAAADRRLDCDTNEFQSLSGNECCELALRDGVG